MRLEGAIEPDLAFALAARHGEALPWASPEAMAHEAGPARLHDFLASLTARLAGLKTAEDFREAAAAALARAWAGGIRHVEMVLTPQLHLPRGVAMGEMVGGVETAFREAAAGQTTRLILSFRREFSEEEGFETLRAAEPFADSLTAVGLSGPEFGNPPQKFARLFARAKEMGFRLTCNAGQEGPPEYVRQAVADLGVERVKHGDAAAEFPAVMQELRERNVTLALCPNTNLALGLLESESHHPLRSFMDAGVKAVLASGDPAWFGDLNANYATLVEGLALSKSEIFKLARASFQSAFLTEPERERHLAALEAAG